MDLNNENFDNDVQLNKAEELVVTVLCSLIFGLPIFAILKMKVYDIYFPVLKNYLLQLF